VYKTIKRCLNCGEQFMDYPEEGRRCPRCGSERVADQMEVIESLREVAREVDLVLVATDPDTEGEKIAWDVALALRPYTREVKRIEFHEVTKRAIERALADPRDINYRLVEAQIVRRVEDRWIGFSLSRKLWGVFEKHWLSAGRVQTPVLGWIIQRYEEYGRSVKPTFRVELENGMVLVLEDVKLDGTSPRELARRISEEGVEINDVRCSVEEVQPPPPFSTDAMLRDAPRALRVGVDVVMALAQDLFELGLITYHRTDSVRVSTAGMAVAREYISDQYGPGEFVAREWAQGGAHECIRPTRPIDAQTLRDLIRQDVIRLAQPLTPKHYALYDIIFKRFMASQMRAARVEVQSFRVSGPGFEKEMRVYIGVPDPGFTRVYMPFRLSPRVEPGRYAVTSVEYRKRPTIPLYSQSDVIQLMKERGIGRPSTYAKIVKTLLDRGYVYENKKGKLIPMKLGIQVYKYLVDNFHDMVSEERTRMIERMMDEIEEGKADYLDVLRNLYGEIVRIEGGDVQGPVRG